MELPVAVALFAVVVAAAIWFLTNRAKPDAEAGAELQTEPETGQVRARRSYARGSTLAHQAPERVEPRLRQSARRPSASEMREARRLQRANRADDGDEAQDENEDEPHPAAAASSAGKKKKSANQDAKRELREYRDGRLVTSSRHPGPLRKPITPCHAASRTAKEEKLESRKDKQALRDEEREAREAEKEEAEAKLLAEKKEQEQEVAPSCLASALAQTPDCALAGVRFMEGYVFNRRRWKCRGRNRRGVSGLAAGVCGLYQEPQSGRS
jgi:hypothetical protein